LTALVIASSTGSTIPRLAREAISPAISFFDLSDHNFSGRDLVRLSRGGEARVLMRQARAKRVEVCEVCGHSPLSFPRSARLDLSLA
jgi:hypothetical protein